MRPAFLAAMIVRAHTVVFTGELENTGWWGDSVGPSHTTNTLAVNDPQNRNPAPTKSTVRYTNPLLMYGIVAPSVLFGPQKLIVLYAMLPSYLMAFELLNWLRNGGEFDVNQ